MSDTTDRLNVIDYLTAPERFGTQTRLAQAAGVKQNTMSDRKKSNTLTHEQMRRILVEGPKMGVQVAPGDFFPEFESGSRGAEAPVEAAKTGAVA